MAVIGITCGFAPGGEGLFLRPDYVRVVSALEGTAVLLPPGIQASTAANLVDGLLLSGGGDIDPLHYNEEPQPGLQRVDPERDLWELELVRIFWEADKPVLAICRGIQVLCVAAGGNLYQDLAQNFSGKLIKHLQDAPRNFASHAVQVDPESKLQKIAGPSLRVNSFHHQAIKDISFPLTVNARSQDGIIEGIESSVHRFVLGLQWHPECMWNNDYPSLNIFRAFIDACRRL